MFIATYIEMMSDTEVMNIVRINDVDDECRSIMFNELYDICSYTLATDMADIYDEIKKSDRWTTIINLFQINGTRPVRNLLEFENYQMENCELVDNAEEIFQGSMENSHLEMIYSFLFEYKETLIRDKINCILILNKSPHLIEDSVRYIAEFL